MPDEGSFLQAILANPTDDLPRLVYADWLEEQQTEAATLKAEFLRVTVALAGRLRSGARKQLQRRLKELARPLPTDWLAVTSRLRIEHCRTAAGARRQPLHVIQFQFECPLKWEALTPTAEVGVRQCEACQQAVYYCPTIGEAREHARAGHCVAVDIAIPRKDGDLFPQRVFRMGRIMPNSRREQRLIAQYGRELEPDEVSAEREERRRKS